MSARKQSVCAHCGCRFEVCRYNAHHQKYCKRRKCVAERKRLRQRKQYRAKYRSDEEFRESEKKRAREGISKRRKMVGQEHGTLCGIDPVHVLTAVVSQLTDERDPVCVMERVRSFAGRGRLLTQISPSRGAPE